MLGIAACCKACIRTRLQAHILSDASVAVTAPHLLCTAVQTLEAISKEFQSQHARILQQLRRLDSQLLV